MSDQRPAKLSQTGADSLAAAWRARLEAYRPFLQQHWRTIAGGTAIVLIALAWIDGGAEAVHPITQAVELQPVKAGNE